MNELVIFGIGGHAREVAQLVADINRAHPGRWNLRGFVADPQAPSSAPKPLSAPMLGDAQWLAQHPTVQTVIAVGAAAARRDIALRLCRVQSELRFATLIHPRAWLADQVAIGEGTVVFAGTLINVDVTIGEHASINLGCTLSHDCKLGDFVSLGPGVHLAGGVNVGALTEIGTGASVRPAVRIGPQVVVGAGATVVDDIPHASAVAGVPAKPMRR